MTHCCISFCSMVRPKHCDRAGWIKKVTLSREVAMAETSFSRLIRTSTHVGISKSKMMMTRKKKNRMSKLEVMR